MSEFYDYKELGFFLDCSKIMVGELDLSVKDVLNRNSTGHSVIELAQNCRMVM